jgi:hypothetical protein
LANVLKLKIFGKRAELATSKTAIDETPKLRKAEIASVFFLTFCNEWSRITHLTKLRLQKPVKRDLPAGWP